MRGSNSMVTRRHFGKLLGATALGAVAGPGLMSQAFAQAASRPPSKAPARGTYLIRNGSVITVDPARGVMLRGDVLVRNGVIEQVGQGIAAPGAAVIDATDMIVMPGLVDTHYHMWSAL